VCSGILNLHGHIHKIFPVDKTQHTFLIHLFIVIVGNLDLTIDFLERLVLMSNVV
jgi:hypothetical protein